jgi:enoyl-CoA hydratase/carnithine racemase
MSHDIDVNIEEGIQVVRFQRPDKKNAFTLAMYAVMSAALEDADARQDIVCTVFLGSAGIFSGGNDINDFMRRATASAAPDEESTPTEEFIQRLPKVTKPMLAGVDGPAIGVATTMLLHCDLVYATPSASLRTPFLDLALVPEAASSLLAPLRMGYARAFELLCLGEPFDAERALLAGLINAIVPVEQLEARVLTAARELARKPAGALLAARRLMRGDTTAVSARMKEEIKILTAQLRSSEAKEAFTAFLEKRAPDFKRKGGS